jgi:hypothetical protein
MRAGSRIHRAERWIEPAQRIFLNERGSLFMKHKVKGPPERAFQCSLAKLAAVSLPLLANLLDAVGFAGGIE